MNPGNSRPGTYSADRVWVLAHEVIDAISPEPHPADAQATLRKTLGWKWEEGFDPHAFHAIVYQAALDEGREDDAAKIRAHFDWTSRTDEAVHRLGIVIDESGRSASELHAVAFGVGLVR